MNHRHALAVLAASASVLTALACSTSSVTGRAAPHAAGIMYSAEMESYRMPSEESGGFNTEEYDHISENPFLEARRNPLSTFSIDVDTASYSNVRRFLTDGEKPPADAVRIEELLNYFSYDYPAPQDGRPFSVTTHLETCPWDTEHRLVHIGLKGREIPDANLPPRNLVFLLDVSGSMDYENKLPLVKRAMKLLVEKLTPRDTIAIVVYAGASGLVLPPTDGNDREMILAALDELSAGGSTNGGEGIQLAYRTARQSFRDGGINRVILATDGDFNVGVTNRGDLTRLIEKERDAGIFLTVLGFGTGNVKDSTMETLADKGNGNYAYIDTIAEARKVLVQEAGGTLVTIAKDVKIQVEFNPAAVGAYRLIGYENRLLRAEDFSDDKKDAGEIGAGHTVTALYEITPPGVVPGSAETDPLRYQTPGDLTEATRSGEILLLKLRYKEPTGSVSKLATFPLREQDFQAESQETNFAAAVAAFGMLLRDSEHKGTANWDLVMELARSGRGRDPHGYREEFVKLVGIARDL